MIQSPALNPALALTMPGDALPASNGDAAQGADFGALLAISSSPAVVAGELADPTASPATTALTQVPAPAITATGGKDLPVALPVRTPSLVEPAPAATLVPKLAAPIAPESAEQPGPAAAKPKVPRATRPLAAVRKVVDPAPVAPDIAAAPQTAAPLAAPQLPSTDALPSPAVLAAVPIGVAAAPAQAVVPGHAEPVAASSAPLPQTTDKPAPIPQAQAAFIHAAPQAALLRAPAVPAEQQSSPAQSATQPAAPAPATPLRIEIALPPPVAAAALRSTPAALRKLALAEPASPAAAALTLTPPAEPAPLQFATPGAGAERPQDFTALLDRLVAAREAAAPQRVSVTLPHAEFGPVQLRFRHEDGALTVSMTSADPDFARAASLAAPPVMPATESRSTAGAGEQNGNHSANNTPGSNTGQPRGHAAERRGDQPAQANSTPQARRDGKPAPLPRGIYA